MTASSDDVLTNYQDKLGPEFGIVFHGLWRDWVWALMRRDEFRTLFSKAEDVALLNALTGGGFTWDLQTIFWDDLLLRVCRLTDPAKMRNKRNLSVTHLPSFCKQVDSSLYERVNNLVNTADERAEFARDWRNRRISHSDYDRALGKDDLALASLEKVTLALDAIHAVLDAISDALLESNIANEMIARPRAQAFLAYARQLVDSVKFIDTIATCDSETRLGDNAIATNFLDRLGVEKSLTNIKHVRSLRQSARRFS